MTTETAAPPADNQGHRHNHEDNTHHILPPYPWEAPEAAWALAAEHLDTDDERLIERTLRDWSSVRPPWAAPMPGFVDPDDWEVPAPALGADGNVIEPDPELVEAARVDIERVTAEHDQRHALRGHPACLRCGVREANYNAAHSGQQAIEWDVRPPTKPVPAELVELARQLGGEVEAALTAELTWPMLSVTLGDDVAVGVRR